MTFARALEALGDGKKVRRKAWPKWMAHIFVRRFDGRRYITIRYADGTVSDIPQLAGADILADDWEAVTEKKKESAE